MADAPLFMHPYWQWWGSVRVMYILTPENKVHTVLLGIYIFNRSWVFFPTCSMCRLDFIVIMSPSLPTLWFTFIATTRPFSSITTLQQISLRLRQSSDKWDVADAREGRKCPQQPFQVHFTSLFSLQRSVAASTEMETGFSLLLLIASLCFKRR